MGLCVTLIVRAPARFPHRMPAKNANRGSGILGEKRPRTAPIGDSGQECQPHRLGVAFLGAERARSRSSKGKPRHNYLYDMALRHSDHVPAQCPHRMPTQRANRTSLGLALCVAGSSSARRCPLLSTVLFRLSTAHCPLSTGFPLTSPSPSAIMRAPGRHFGVPEHMLTRERAAEIHHALRRGITE